jgi:hypothetical protein
MSKRWKRIEVTYLEVRKMNLRSPTDTSRLVHVTVLAVVVVTVVVALPISSEKVREMFSNGHLQ